MIDPTHPCRTRDGREVVLVPRPWPLPTLPPVCSPHPTSDFSGFIVGHVRFRGSVYGGFSASTRTVALSTKVTAASISF